MAKRHLEQYDSDGNLLESYLNTDEVKVGEGKFLDEKLSEMENDIEAAGQVNEIIMNGDHYTPEDKVIDLGTVTGEKGDKGDQGDTVLISETPQEFAGMIVNDLTTGGGGNALSAEMGKRLRNKIIELESNVQDMLSKLANLAFIGEKPTYPPIDWSAPSYVVSLDLTNIGNASVEGTFPMDVLEGNDATITVKPNPWYELDSVSYKIGASGTTQTATVSGGKAVITVRNVSADITVFITTTTTAIETHDISAQLKKITSFAPKYGVTGNTDNDISGVTLNTATVTSGTPECSLSVSRYAYGYPLVTEVIPATGYAIYSVKVMMGGNNITGTAYDPDTHEISIDNPDSTLTIEAVVGAAGSDGMFVGSFYGFHTGDDSLADNANAGIIVDEDATGSDRWVCQSDFVKVPTGTKSVLWILGTLANRPYNPSGANVNGQPCKQRRNLIMYDENFVPISSMTDWDKKVYERGFDLSAIATSSGKTIAYIRASFCSVNWEGVSILNSAAIKFSSNTYSSSMDWSGVPYAWQYNNNQ